MLQNAFDKNGIKKSIDVENLKKVNSINANYQFCNWIKKYYETNFKGEPTYDALKSRKGRDLHYLGNVSNPNTKHAKKSTAIGFESLLKLEDTSELLTRHS